MKKTLYILTAILLMATSCEKTGNSLIDKIVGEWHYTTTENGITEDIWLSFDGAGTFEMYQKIGEGPYWHSTGEFEADPATGILTGVYSDRYPWKYSYKVTATSGTLTMTAAELDTYTVSYTREAIPAEVRAASLPLTRSSASEYLNLTGLSGWRAL